MIRISFAVFLTVLAWAMPSYAQTAPALTAIQQDEQEIRALKKQREDAERANDAVLVQQLQAEIEQKKAELHNEKETETEQRREVRTQKNIGPVDKVTKTRLQMEYARGLYYSPQLATPAANLSPDQVNTILFSVPVATVAPVCTENTAKVGNIAFLIDTSGSMHSQDVTSANGNTTRIAAAQGALDSVIPAIVSEKTQNDPTRLVGLATFETYYTRKNNQRDASSRFCGSLSGLPSSECLFNSFDSRTVDQIVTAPGTATITGAQYTTALTSLIAVVNGVKAAGNTPLYDTMLQMATALQNGTAEKPSALVVLSDGGDNHSNATNISMIDTLAATYPNMQIDFVFVGPASQAKKVRDKIYMRTPGGNQLQGQFIAVQDTAGITNALISAVFPCQQP